MHIMCRKYMKYLNINIEYLLQYLVDETNFYLHFFNVCKDTKNVYVNFEIIINEKLTI